MKKILAIALAVVLGLASLSSLALIDRGDDTSARFVFDAVQISTNYAVTATEAPVATIGDPAGAYNADKVIYGVLKISYDQNRTGGVNQMEYKITSDDVLFPAYMNTGTATVHYTDKFGLLRLPSYNYHTLMGTVDTYVAKGSIETDTTKNQVKIVLPTGNWDSFMVPRRHQRSAFPNVNGESTTATVTATNDGVTTTFYAGFSGLVKDGGAKTEGKITVNMTLSAGSFSNGPLVTATITNAAGATSTANYQAIDIYANGVQKYRILKLANEYVVHPVIMTGNSGEGTRYANYAVGFRSTSTAFQTLSYYNMPEYYTAIVGNSTTLIGAGNVAQAAVEYTVQARINDFEYLVPGSNPQVWSSIKPYYQPIMDYFGFSFAYSAALKDSDFSGKAGLTSTKDATFAYFGTVVEEPDDDVDVPQTGDASASILVVLGASAILAAAALAFVMKKARD